MTVEEAKNLTYEQIEKLDAKVEKLIEKGYAKADKLSDAEYDALPEDWEDKISEDATIEVWGSIEAMEAALQY